MSKIFLCGITQNKREDVSALTKNFDCFDGLIFVDGGSTDGTLDLLNERKGGGKIIQRNWTNDHDFQMNEFLRQGPLQNGDWFIVRDSEERINDEFCKNIRNHVLNFLSQKIRSVYWEGKGAFFQYFDDMYFSGSPHWGLVGARQHSVNLNDEVVGGKWFWNERQNTRDRSHWIKHHLKYYWVYGRSNHLLLGRENKIEEFRELELERIQFRILCQQEYGLDFSIESLHEFFASGTWKENKQIVEIYNKQPILKRYYHRFVLGESEEEIIAKFGTD